jgi:hypothetical protein
LHFSSLMSASNGRNYKKARGAPQTTLITVGCDHDHKHELDFGGKRRNKPGSRTAIRRHAWGA